MASLVVVPIFAAVACSAGSSASDSSGFPPADAAAPSDSQSGPAQPADAATEAASPFASCPSHPTTGDFPIPVGTVLRDKCQTCHKQPPVQHAPFPLLTYEDTVGPDPIPPFSGQPIWQVMHFVIQPGAVPHMPFGTAPQLTPAEFQTLDDWLTSCAAPVAEGTGGDVGEAEAGAGADAASD